MIGAMTEPTEVYLIEDNTDPEPDPNVRYFAHVYLSRDKAKAGVEYWANRGGHGLVRWQEHAPVSYAFPSEGPRQSELYRVVPLRVHPDDQPER
jgi:hypothetical protein